MTVHELYQAPCGSAEFSQNYVPEMSAFTEAQHNTQCFVPPSELWLSELEHCQQHAIHQAALHTPHRAGDSSVVWQGPSWDPATTAPPISPSSTEEGNSMQGPRCHSISSTLSNASTSRAWIQDPAFASCLGVRESLCNMDGGAKGVYVPNVAELGGGRLGGDQLDLRQYFPRGRCKSRPMTKAQIICGAAGRGSSILGLWESTESDSWVRRSHTVVGSSSDHPSSTTTCRQDNGTRATILLTRESTKAGRIKSTKSGPPVPRSGKDRCLDQWKDAPCLQCCKVFTGQYGRGNLARHVRHKHQAIPEIICSFCEKTYKRTDALRKHVKERHF